MFKYLEVLFRYWFRFALLCVALPLVAGGAALYLFQGKDGSAQLWVDNPGYFGNIQTATGWNQYLTPAQNTVDSLTQLILTDTFYGKLGQALTDSGAVKNNAELNQVLGETRGTLGAVPSGSHLVTIRVECHVDLACVQVLTTTIALHREWLIQTEKQQAAIATQLYTSQLNQAKKDQQVTINALNAYLAAHPVPPNTMRGPDAELDRLQSDVHQTQARVIDIQDKLDNVQSSSDAADQIDQTALRVVDPPRTSTGHFTAGTKKAAVVSAAVAVLPGIAYLVILAWIDRTTRNPKEIEGRLGVRVVATIGSLSREPG